MILIIGAAAGYGDVFVCMATALGSFVDFYGGRDLNLPGLSHHGNPGIGGFAGYMYLDFSWSFESSFKEESLFGIGSGCKCSFVFMCRGKADFELSPLCHAF
ncbi:hypothetical protein SDC9_139047 [bioreactor metagenome]|uniref:Uncharacterized protein n=1 Tax=bioreactor metagenome TaxID=1076179 RepID=A0A645DTJ7_9ZZZZ